MVHFACCPTSCGVSIGICYIVGSAAVSLNNFVTKNVQKVWKSRARFVTRDAGNLKCRLKYYREVNETARRDGWGKQITPGGGGGTMSIHPVSNAAGAKSSLAGRISSVGDSSACRLR